MTFKKRWKSTSSCETLEYIYYIISIQTLLGKDQKYYDNNNFLRHFYLPENSYDT